MADVLKNQKMDTECGREDMLIKAAESYNQQAMLQLGIIYRDRAPSDMNAAIKWLILSAERNNVRAQMALGDIYLKGSGVEKDPHKAFIFYTRAHLNGNSRASYRISMMYKNGTGVEKNIEKYREFLQIALDGGDLESILESKMAINKPK
jgi:TPR repeat protein